MRNGPVSHPLPRQRMILFCTQAWMRNWPSLERMEHMTTSNERIASTGKNIQEKANLIWNVANTLFGAFKPHEYGLVILPMAVIKRFHDCLLPTHQAVLDKYKEVQHLAVKEGFLCAASGYQFYNISPFTFETLKADPENINENFRAFLNGFSDNVQDILARMNFHAQIDRMEEAGLLYQVVVDFCSEQGDMRPEKISAVDMGYIFENLVQRFSESYNEEAGAHFTSRDIIYLMCDLLVSNAKFDGDGISKTVYDMTMGTSQMLTCMEERLKQLDADADVTCFGQELNPFTFGIAKADMLIRGGDPDNMQFGNTLDDDKFSGYQFDYEISNPPFGIDWKREAPKVEAEHKKGGAGRFGPGLPSKSDGQMLFMLNGLAKLKPDGRMAIIQNGSSLFTGDAGSGQSEIRRYLRDNNTIRVSRSMRDLAYKALQTKEQLSGSLQREPSVEEIAKAMNIDREDIVLALESIQEPVSLFEPVYHDDGDALYVMDQVQDTKNTDVNWIENLSLSEAMKKLTPRERHILNMRFFEGKTQMEVAKEISISQAQVSRLEKNALKYMRKYV